MIETLHVSGPDAMHALGAQLARRCQGNDQANNQANNRADKQVGCIIFLSGQLGTGKTTWVRGFIREYGYTGLVKSPTYTLIEPYMLDKASIYHVDLYRLSDPVELEAIELRDYFDGASICLIEWPEIGRSVLPAADIEVRIDHCVGDPNRRALAYGAGSDQGQAILARRAPD